MGSCGIRRPASSVVVVAQMVHDILADLGDLLSGLSDLGFGLGNLRRETSLAGGNLGRYEALDVPRSHPRCTGDGRDDTMTGHVSRRCRMRQAYHAWSRVLGDQTETPMEEISHRTPRRFLDRF